MELIRNFGKEAAMLVGLDYAYGRCVAAVLVEYIGGIYNDARTT